MQFIALSIYQGGFTALSTLLEFNFQKGKIKLWANIK